MNSKKKDKAIISKNYDLFQHIIDDFSDTILNDIENRKKSPSEAISESREFFLDMFLEILDEE